MLFGGVSAFLREKGAPGVAGGPFVGPPVTFWGVFVAGGPSVGPPATLEKGIRPGMKERTPRGRKEKSWFLFLCSIGATDAMIILSAESNRLDYETLFPGNDRTSDGPSLVP